tara:strand:- start:881 stop:1099 length:219 start_codon:yes stop_codon:yes gene_type:complete
LFGEQGGETTSARAGFFKKWGWYSILFSGLAQGDIGRLEDITKLNVHTCLFALSYMKDKTELEAQQMKNKFK